MESERTNLFLLNTWTPLLNFTTGNYFSDSENKSPTLIELIIFPSNSAQVGLHLCEYNSSSGFVNKQIVCHNSFSFNFHIH